MSLYRIGTTNQVQTYKAPNNKNNLERSKSSNFASRFKKQEAEERINKVNLKTLVRAATAFREANETNVLPRVSSVKGKLHLGKMTKPDLIMGTEYRLNPWGEPKPVTEKMINRKGLMDIVNMGLIPKNTDFTELLNYKYEEKKNDELNENEDDTEFFNTNPIILENQKDSEANNLISNELKLEKIEKSIQNQNRELEEASKKIRKRINKNSSVLVKKQYDLILQIPEEPIILRVVNQTVEKSVIYNKELEKVRKNGNLIAFKHYLKCIENFAVRFGFKKFEFKVVIDETKKITDNTLRNNIINAEACGIRLAMRGRIKERIFDIGRMLMCRYKFKKAKKDLMKIEKIKRSYRNKKFFELMSCRRTDFLKYKLGSFAERQRRFFVSAREGELNESRVYIHLLGISDSNYEEERSYYKIECRNNIQLTRIFCNEPEFTIVLTEKPLYLTSWFKLMESFNQQKKPTIIPMFSSLTGYKVRSYDSIYCGIGKDFMNEIWKIYNKNEEPCLFPSSFNSSLVKISEILNARVYCPSYWGPHLEKILAEEEEENVEAIPEQNLKFSNEIIVESVTKTNAQNKSKSQIRYEIQKSKAKEMNSYKLVSEYFSNKLKIKEEIFLQNGIETPFSIIYQPDKDENKFYEELTKAILVNKSTNKWVFKIGSTARFSRGLAFLETDSLKILKEKKKKFELLQSDIQEVSLIMKIILLDKLFVCQNYLQDTNEFLEGFLRFGGYVEAVIADSNSEGVFGEMSPQGECKIKGTYTKIYTEENINCAAMYPSQNVPISLLSKVKEVAELLYEKFKIFGHFTYEIIVEKQTQKYFFIDFHLCLEQYSSLYFMYKSMMSGINPLRNEEKGNDEELSRILELERNIIYIPFIDNNGNTCETFEDFEHECAIKQIKMLDSETLEGNQFLYLNLHELKPDVLSLLVLSKSDKKILKYALDGLNFLVESGEKTNRFDRKVERRKYDSLYIHDIVWKFREIKKSKDSKPQ